MRSCLTNFFYFSTAERFKTDSISVLKGIQKEYRDIFRLRAPGKSIVVVFKPEDVCTIYKNDGKWPNSPGFDPLVYYRSKRPDLYQGNGKN